jgi:Tfp pilus assembly PilM family ATPase
MQFLGLHLEKKILTIALVAKENKRFKVKFLETLFLEEGSKKELKQLLELIAFKEKKSFIVSTLETHSILLRSLEIPLKSHRGLLKTLPFQLEHIIPYPLEEVIVIPTLEKMSSTISKESSIVTLFCCHERFYAEHLEKYKSYGIDPHWIGCIPQSLYRFSKYYTEEKDFITLHMASDGTHIVAVLEDRPCHAFQIEIGKQDFLEALRKDMPISEEKEIENLFHQIDCFNLSQDSFLHFSLLINRFLKELDRVFYFLLHKKEGRRLDKLFLAKEESFLISFKGYIEQSLDFSLQIIDSKHSDIKELKPYAVAIGAAIDVLSNDHKTLQIRKLLDTQPQISRSVLKKVGTYAFCTLVSCLVLAFSSHFLLKQKENRLNKKLSSLIERYPQEVAESKEESKLFFSRLKQVEKQFSKAKKPYTYYLTPVQVSEFIKCLYKEEQFLGTSLVKIERVDYELMQYPTIEEPLEPYKIKIHLTITADEEQNAENFFEALFKNTVYLEESSRPALTKEKDEYQAIFFLKTFK